MKQDRFVLTAGFMPAVVMALLLLAENLLGQGALPTHIWVLAAAELGTYLAPLLLLRLLKDSEGKTAVFRCRPFKRRAVWFVLWMSIAAALLAALLNGAVSLLLKENVYTDTLSLLERYGVTAWWQVALVVVILPAVTEELFFRGVMFSALEREGTLPALLLTSAAFAMIHGDLGNLAGPFAAGMIYGYMVYVLDSVWPAVFAHLVNNGLHLFLAHAARSYSVLGIWSYIVLIALFLFCLFLALAMRSLEGLIEKGRIRRLQNGGFAATLSGIFVSPGMWLLLILFLVRILYW